MMKRQFAVLCAGLLVLGQAFAADEPKEKIKEALKLIVPDSEPDSIVEAPIPGLFEVAYGLQVFYVSQDGRFAMQGEIYDLEHSVNLTEEKRAKGRKVIIDKVDDASTVMFSPPNPKHVVTVFTDIDCPYCRRMHEEMDQYNELGIAIRYMLYPRAGIASKSYRKARAVWCAEDRLKAMTEAKAGKDLPDKSCENPILEHMQIAQEVGLAGTPMIILEDGTVISGYLPPDRLSQALEGSARF